MKQERYYLILDSYDRNIIINGLNKLRTHQINESRPTEPVDNLIIKVSTAPTRKVKKVIEGRHEAR
jgi:hypothetical protein